MKAADPRARMELDDMMDANEIQALKSRAGALEELLETYEKAVFEQSGKLYEDITKRKDLERQLLDERALLTQQAVELEKAYDELKAAQSRILQQEKMASIGQLAAGVAHEVNNPIGFIISNLNSLRKYMDRISDFIMAQTEALGKMRERAQLCEEERAAIEALIAGLEEQRRAVKLDYICADIGNLVRESLEGAERVKRIVQDLKNFSRADDVEHITADINAGLESTLNIVWNELKYKVTLTKEYGDIPTTKCNPGQLNQVFMNLLLNAAQAIEKKGEIVVKTWQSGCFIHISVSDTGCGIPAGKISRIFEPFYTTKEVGKGTGLGLSIAYDIIGKHKGTIIAASEEGKGTTFTITLPIVEKD